MLLNAESEDSVAGHAGLVFLFGLWATAVLFKPSNTAVAMCRGRSIILFSHDNSFQRREEDSSRREPRR